MFNLFKSKIENSWGFHITERHMRYVEIEGNKSNWRISRIGKLDLSPNVVDNGFPLVKNHEAFKDAIKQLRSKTFPNPSKSPYVIVNLAEELAFSRVIQTPHLEKNEIDEALKWEAESNIPLPIDKVYLAWEPLPVDNTQTNSVAGQKKESLLLAAALKNIVDDLVGSLEESGLIPVVIESESTALVRSLSQTQSFPSADIPIMILNLREHYTHIIAFDSRVVTLSTTTENCSEKFDSDIESTFKITREDSEKYRQKIGWNFNDEFGKKLIEATAMPFSALKKDIGSAMSFFENKTGKSLRGILLTGEKLSKWNAFDKFLEKEVGVPVEWQSDWSPKIWPANCPYAKEEKEEYNIAIGLALRKLEGEL